MMDRAPALHPRPRAGFVLLALGLALSLGRPASPVAAAEAPCQQPARVAAVTAAAPDERLAALPELFQTTTSIDRERLLADAQRQVAAELRGIGAPACFLELVPTIAERTALLSPFEFMIVGYYDSDVVTRDEVLRLYREDPRQAMRRMSAFWPSPRAEMLVRTPAFFDIDANQIFVNLGEVTPEDAPNVVAHEFWHALANVEVRTVPGGAQVRTTAFWSELAPAGSKAWRPVEEELAGGIPTYLMNEAVAIEMEVAATGRDHPGMRPDLIAAVEVLHELFDSAGRERVLRLYLESRSDELKQIARDALRAV